MKSQRDPIRVPFSGPKVTIPGYESAEINMFYIEESKSVDLIMRHGGVVFPVCSYNGEEFRFNNFGWVTREHTNKVTGQELSIAETLCWYIFRLAGTDEFGPPPTLQHTKVHDQYIDDPVWTQLIQEIRQSHPMATVTHS